jgi:predicted nuclease of predicted toxin-antitoxin system
MNLSPDWVAFLRSAGHEALHWSTVGSPSASDRTITAWAVANAHIIFTNDLDFSAILAATQAETPSVLQVRTQDLLPDDGEVIAMEIIAEYQGMDQDKTIWQYFRRHWQSWFPNLPSRSSFVRQSTNLWQYKQQIQHQFAEKLGAFEDEVHLIDGLPMQLCCLTYAGKCQSFQGIASYGYCAAKDEKFYGFRGHLNISLRGVITGFTIIAANADEREALWEIMESTRGLLIGDKGYLNDMLKDD